MSFIIHDHCSSSAAAALIWCPLGMSHSQPPTDDTMTRIFPPLIRAAAASPPPPPPSTVIYRFQRFIILPIFTTHHHLMA